MHISGEQGPGFHPCTAEGLLGWQSAAFKAHSQQEWSGLNSAPQGTALHGHGQDRATQPLCTSVSASPDPGTTRKGEAVAVLFQSRTKASFILSGDATFRFAMSVSVLRLAVCAHLVRAHLYREN